MRIAYVCADAGIPVFGHKGSAVHVREMCAALDGLGHEVTLLACGAFGSPPPLLHGVEVVPLPTPRSTEAGRREREAVALNRATHHALTVHGPFDLVYERASLWSVAGPRFAARAGTPGVLEVNAPLVDEQVRYRNLVHRGAAERLFAQAVRLASIVTAVSAEVAETVRVAAGAREHVHVVPNGVARQRFALASARIRPRPDRFTIGFVGSLRPWHGVEHLIEATALALPAIPNLHLLIVGDGPQRGPLTALVEARGLGAHVTFVGAVPQDEVPACVAAMDVAVAPYPALEHFYFSPLKVLEYMAAGRPVVASALGQIRELVSDGVSGCLVPPGDARAMAAALVRLAADPGLRARMGGRARSVVANGHDWRDVAARILRLAGAIDAPTPGVRRPA